MTTEDNESAVIPEVLKQNIETLEELNQRFVSVLQNKKQINPSLNGPGQDLMVKASHAYWSNFMENPANLMEKQISYWGKTLEYFVDAQHAFTQGQFQIPKADGKPDRRFTHEMWSSNPYFNFVKEHYLRTSDLINSAISDLDGMELKEKRRLEFFTRQIVDMMSPTNFLATNPDALERAMETQGQSLIDGMQNLIADLEANEGELVVRLADESAFEVGGNIATAKGSVVFRNEMLELIQYASATETVYETPIIMFPPWINKYYILDLKEQNSLIRWVVDQGYTLFVVSWVNPDASYADIGMEDYIEHGYLKSIEVVKEITDQPQVNAIGYCIAGTTLALTLSLLKQRKDDSVKSATFFTALTDFSEQREFTPFLQNDFIDAIEDEINDKGILESFIMARTFSFLRANDLVYGPAVKSYMMGEAPPAFDLLYWNGDGSSLPGKMAIQYLRGLCQDNKFATGEFELLGHTLKLSDVDVPLCSVACETDHIASWPDCYRGVQNMGSSDKTFILSESGHIAGIVNPPSKKKYGHYTLDDSGLDADDWKEGASFNEGSWWPRWNDWISPRSGDQVLARIPGSGSFKAICDAPGTYVLRKSHV